jgi:preprotein translocase subunit SecA
VVKNEPNLDDEMLERIVDADDRLRRPRSSWSAPSLHQFERNVMLQSLDTHWREHLAALDHLRQGIHLRGYAQKNPKQEYKREAFELFERCSTACAATSPAADDRAGPRRGCRGKRTDRSRSAERPVPPRRLRRSAGHRTSQAPPAATSRQPMPQPKVGRNDPCPCGSGKKYKHCHGKLRSAEELGVGDTPVANPAFDVTPADLVSGFISERGVAQSGALHQWQS